jgi:hypothetical protein
MEGRASRSHVTNQLENGIFTGSSQSSRGPNTVSLYERGNHLGAFFTW